MCYRSYQDLIVASLGICGLIWSVCDGPAGDQEGAINTSCRIKAPVVDFLGAEQVRPHMDVSKSTVLEADITACHGQSGTNPYGGMDREGISATMQVDPMQKVGNAHYAYLSPSSPLLPPPLLKNPCRLSHCPPSMLRLCCILGLDSTFTAMQKLYVCCTAAAIDADPAADRSRPRA